MRWDDSDRADRAVAESGSWCKIHDLRRVFPHSSGVFLFADDRGEVRYIGKARRPRLGVEAWGAVFRAKARQATVALWMATQSDAEAVELEARLRHKYRPPNNPWFWPTVSAGHGGV